MLGGAQAMPTCTYSMLAPGSIPYTSTVPIVSPPLAGAGAVLGTLTGAPGYSLLSQSGVSSSFTFCVELFQALSTSAKTYSVVDPAVAAAYTTLGANGWGPTAVTISGKIDSLMAAVLPSVNSAASAAALQLAIWEVIYDVGPVYNVLAGTGFAVTLLPADAAVGTQANLFLLGIGTAATRHYSVLTNPDFQDVLIQVPEPMSASLVLLGLLGAAAARRRKPT